MILSKNTTIATAPKLVVDEVEVDITDVLNSSFLDYSAFVLQRRALPDARDAIKYTARQILHAQKKDKLDCQHPKKKSQKSVAAATSFSYVHGDTSAYGQMIHMGRDLVIRYPLEDFTGNSGTIVGSKTYAAARYTECRLSELGTQLFDYLDENVLDANKDWQPTYDDVDYFPIVAPSVGYYNLCNGSFGSIGVGLISSIPQFNLREVNDAICKMIDNPKYEAILYPDFASGGILLNPKTTCISLSKGEGKSALLRGEVIIDPDGKYLEVVSLPYGVYTETFCKELETAYNKGTVPFRAIKDLSKKTVKVRIYSDNLNELEDWLYKNTSVQKHFTIKLIMLDEGKVPKLFTISQALQAHIIHTKKVFRRHFEYQLQTLQDREEILNGLIKAYSILDNIIALIKTSEGRSDAINKLCAMYDFTIRQAEAIVDLRLHRLSKIDIQKLEEELSDNLLKQKELLNILNSEPIFNNLLKQEYQIVSKRYGDDRRTKIYKDDDDKYESDEEGSMPNKDYYLVGDTTRYWASTQEDDEIFNNIEDNNEERSMHLNLYDDIIFITNKGKCILRKANELKMGKYSWEESGIKENIVYFQKRESLPEFLSVAGKTYHKSYFECAATKRGKKFQSGNWDLKQEEIMEI